MSKDPVATKHAFEQIHETSFKLGSAQGDAALRKTIATELYQQETSRIAADDVIIANGTTGANHIVHQAILKPGDHVVCQYPIYGPCIEEPQSIGCDISYLELDPTHGWRLSIERLASLIRPGKTKLLMLNNPSNPTGTYFDTKLQMDIIDLCKKHDIIIHSDEIFRPFFHGLNEKPNSMIEHANLGYDKIIVTSSLSKVYGLSGVRIGWIATRSAEMRKAFMSYRVMSISAVSRADEIIATEVLGARCRTTIIQRHLDMAKKNIGLIQQLVDAHNDKLDWVKPTAGAVGFVRIRDPETNQAVDDVTFCKELLSAKNVLLAPASLCFDFDQHEQSFKGRVRIAFTTTTENLQKGLAQLDEMLREKHSRGADH